MWDYLFTDFSKRVFKHGSLVVQLASGKTLRMGGGTDAPVEVTLHDPSLTRKIMRNPDMAVGEAYMNGGMTIKDDDLFGFLSLAVRNMGRNGERFNNPTSLQKFTQFAQRMLRKISQHNPIGRAQENVAHHYDLSDALYDIFLDADKPGCG